VYGSVEIKEFFAMNDTQPTVTLPKALWRGFTMRCPNCAHGALFRRYLKVVECCPACHENFSHERADDFPAYLVIVIVGHGVVPAMLFVEEVFAPAVWLQYLIWLPHDNSFDERRRGDFLQGLGPRDAQPIVFHHGWPLSADDWDGQMMFFLGHGFRVVAHDRRGHGRSTQISDGHDMDHYADDVAAVVEHLDLRKAIHVGHSTGGGEVARYLARHGESRAAKAALISAVPPFMLKTAANPGGLPKSVFDDLQAQLAASRTQFYYDFASGPFYGYNRPGAKASQAIIWNWWRQGMMGGAKAHYDGIVAFSQTDFTEDLKKIGVPVLVMHGDDDQIVPYADSAPLSAKLLKKGTLKTYQGYPHGMPTTHADTINADLLAFFKS
jgi:non-heme chloroperoxidase